jgi:hypothetical protein
VANLGWVAEIIKAPDLEAFGEILDSGLRSYVAAGTPHDQDALAGRWAFEHVVRRYMTRAEQRGYLYPLQFKHFCSNWMYFVRQNEAAENNIADRVNVRAEAGKAEANELAAPQTTQGAQGFSGPDSV